MPRAAILDDYQNVALDLADWEKLRPAVSLTVFNDHLFDEAAIAARLRDFEIVVINRERTPFTRSLFEKLPKLKFLATNGNLIAVGDDAQAIYGFRGADSTSLDTIIDTFNAEQLPLDTTYRCPKSIVEIAQQYVPEINCPPTAPEGTVTVHDKFDLDQFENEDLVICRNTAPLITSAYRMIRLFQSGDNEINQNNIFNWFKDAAKVPAESRSLVVKAVAGSGKTTTIAEASKYIPVDVASVFLAFNKSIATELGKKLPTNVESRTLNSLGHRAVMGKFGQIALDPSKTMKIVRELGTNVTLAERSSNSRRNRAGDEVRLLAHTYRCDA